VKKSDVEKANELKQEIDSLEKTVENISKMFTGLNKLNKSKKFLDLEFSHPAVSGYGTRSVYISSRDLNISDKAIDFNYAFTRLEKLKAKYEALFN